MRTVVVTPPSPIISLDEAKAHLKVEHDEDDAVITGMVEGAVGHLDGPHGWLGRALGPQTLECYLPAFGATSIALPFPPALEIAEIAYVGDDGAEVVLPADAGELRGSLLRPRWPTVWPQPAWRGGDGETVRIRYRAGYETLPSALRSAILLMVGDLYRNRDTVAAVGAVAVPMSTTVENLLSPFRVWC